MNNRENPRNKNIRNHAIDARKQGEIYRKEVLIWLFKWGFASEEVLKKLLGLDTRRIGASMAKRGILTKVTLPFSEIRQVYTIAHQYQLEARTAWEQDMYTVIDTSKMIYKSEVPFSRVQHEIFSQLSAIAAIKKTQNAQNAVVLLSEREILSSAGEERLSAVPDFLIWEFFNDNIEKKTWYEVELNGKYQERLTYQLQTRQAEIEEGNADEIVFLCGTPGIAANLEQALKKERIPKTTKNSSHKIVHAPGIFWNPEKLRGVTRVVQIKDFLNEKKENQLINTVLIDMTGL
jgi:hypothetical protein